MANTIQHKRSSTSGVAPVASGLSQGELAINIADGKFYTKNSANSVINLGVTSISGTYITPSSGNFFNYLAVNGVPVSVSGHSHTTVQQAESLVTTVFNETGSTLSKMTAVYINGGHGDRPTIQKAIATSDVTSAGTYGLVYADIDHNQEGQVIVFGSLSGVNTDPAHSGIAGATEGSVLYLSPTTSGAITTTKPYAPDHIVAIGTVVRVHQNEGIIEVRVQNGFELDELHNVAISGATNGQFLQYNSTNGLWVPSSSGNFSSLSVNNTGVSLSGHNHNGVYADIATGDPQTPSNSIVDRAYALYDLPNDFAALWINDAVVYAADNVIFDSFKINMGLSNAVTGTGVANHVAYWNSSSGIVADSGQLYWDSTNNRLGVGTTSPLDLIHISGATASSVGIRFDNNDGHGGSVQADNGQLYLNSSTATAARLSGRKIRLGDGGASACAIELSSVGTISQDGNGGGLSFSGTTGQFSNGLHVTAGNVGIGTTTPSGQLHVIGTGLFSNSIGINTNSNSVGATSYALLVDGDVSVGSGNAARTLSVWGNNTTKRLLLKNVNGNSFLTYVIGSQDLNLGGPQPTDYPFNNINYYAGSTSAGMHRFHVSVDGTGLPPAMVIANSGVGIGTTSPSYTLDVSGTIGVSGIARFNNDIYMLDTTKRISWDNGTEYIGRQGDGIIIGTQSTTKILVNSAGNVGIGTESPAESLTVYGDSKYLYLQAQNNTGAAGIKFGNTAARQQMYIEGTSSDLVIDSMNGGVTESIRIGYNTGAVTINESGSDLDFRVEGDTDTNLVFVDASTDRVGIGTSTPSDKLNIVGNISAGTVSNTQGKFIAYGSASQPNLLFEGFGTDGTARISTNSGANRQLKIENDGASTTLGVYIEGNVGIGTTTPSGQLHVVGTGLFSNKLGVGTNAPTYDLDIRTNSDNALYVAQGAGARYLLFGNGGFINNTTLSVSKAAWSNLASLEVNTVIPARRGLVIEQVANQTANAIETRDNASTVLSYIGSGGGAYFGGNVGIGTTNPSVQLDVAGSGRFRGRCRVDNLTINTDTTTDNTAPYLATMLLGSDGASLSGGGLQITTNTNRDANKALLGLVNNKLKTLSGASTFAKTTFSSEYNADTSVNSTQTPNGNFVNILTLESGNLTLVNQNLYIKNSPAPTAYDNDAGTIINSQAYIYMQGASSGSPARFNNVYNYYSRGQFAASHSYTTNFVDFYAAPIVGQIVPSGGVTTRTALLIDYYDGNTAHITNPRGIWQLGSGVTNHLAGKVGIGTTSPNELLEVSGNLRLSDRSGSTGFKIQFNRGGGTANDYTIGKEGNHLAISTSNDNTTNRYTEFGYHAAGTWTPKTRLNNYTGALGVNLTATPSGSLDVGGDIYVRGAGTTGVMYFKSGSLADTTCRVRTDTNGNIYLEGGGANVRCGSQDGRADMYASSQWITIGNTYDAGTANQYVRFVPANTEMMRVTKTGVGFGGVTSPLDRIHVSGTQTTIRLNNGLSYDTQLRMIDTASDWSVGINQGNSAGSGVFSIRSVTASSHRLVITPSGDIGIGTITPSGKLHVVGNSAFTGDIVQNGLLTQSSNSTTISTASTTTLFTIAIPATTATNFSIKISAYNATNSATASWNLRGLVKRISTGNCTLVGDRIIEKWADSTFNTSTVDVGVSTTNIIIQATNFPASSTTVKMTISYI